MNESPTARAMMIPIALVEFIPFLPSNQKIKAVKIAGSKRGKIEFKISWKSIIFSPIGNLYEISKLIIVATRAPIMNTPSTDAASIKAVKVLCMLLIRLTPS